MQPAHGAWFAPEDHVPRSGQVMLSYDEATRLFGQAAAAVGKLIDTSEGRLRGVGVMPRAFDYPAPSIGAWLARGPYRADAPSFRVARIVEGIGRLKPGLDATAAHAQLATMIDAKEDQDGWRLTCVGLLDDIVGELRGTLWVAFAIGLLVLLIALVNVAILFDARQTERAHEQALAQALGAAPTRLRRARWLEAAALAVLGVMQGAIAAWAGMNTVRELARDSLPRVDAIALDPVVLAFAAVLGLLTPFAVSLLSAWRPRASMPLALRGAGRGLIGGGAGWRAWLPALAIAFSTLSLIIASAFTLSLMRLRSVDPGFDPKSVRALQFFSTGAPETLDSRARELQDRLAAVPGVDAVAVTTAAPYSRNGWAQVDLTIAGRADVEPYQAALRRVGPGYHELLGIPLLAGRDISAEDRAEGEPVAVISRELAHRSFGDASPLGRSIRLAAFPAPERDYRIVGVVDDTRNLSLRDAAEPEVLIAFAQQPWAGMTFLVRTREGIAVTDAQLAAPIWSIDPRQSITRQFRLSDDIDAQLTTTRFFSRTVGLFAGCAIVLAAFGVYAVAALDQRRRVREFGLRVAVGARPARLGLTVLREGAVTVIVGIGLGLVGAWAALRFVEAQMYQVDAWQRGGLMLAGVVAIAVASLLALTLPAWRAVRIDPMVALRDE
jgi:predicted permease